jgi:hypothetical protein
MKTIAKALRDTDILPASVQESHYRDEAEMTKGEIIDKTLREMGRYWSWGQGSQSSDDSGYLPAVIAELQRRLPDGNIKLCGDFRDLNAACCETGHTFYPHHDTKPIELPHGGMAWVCHGMEWAIYPARYAELKERTRNSPEGMLFRKIFGNNGRPEQ